MLTVKDKQCDGHEQVVFCRDASVGLRAIIAIHSTVLGPAQGRTEDRAMDCDDRTQAHRGVPAEHDLLVAVALFVFHGKHRALPLRVGARGYSTIEEGRTVSPMRDATGSVGLTMSGLLGRLRP